MMYACRREVSRSRQKILGWARFSEGNALLIWNMEHDGLSSDCDSLNYVFLRSDVGLVFAQSLLTTLFLSLTNHGPNLL